MSPKSASKPRPARLIIIDDHPAVREALALRIARHSDMKLVGEADGYNTALRLISTTHPDVAIVDIGLKEGNGLDLIKRLRDRGETLRVLVWSMYNESLYAERALRAGAQGYITKQQATEDIIGAVREVLAGRVYLSPDMTQQLLGRSVGTRSGPALPEECLSDRELEVYRLMGQGLSARSIAERMRLSPKTVETYRERIKEKLGLATTPELLRHAIRWVEGVP
ncbi:MAG TPA: response regulator transcription factor [Gemmatales bacterium]|nr:response regulator transcription factor [Gemmatales bacterium]HMP59986.1 response regulator transcription factor [Gemmatales bacterium]